MKETKVAFINDEQLKAYFSEYIQFTEHVEQLCYAIRSKERKIFGQPVTPIVDIPDMKKMVVNVTWLLIQHIQQHMESDVPGLQIEVLDVLKKTGVADDSGMISEITEHKLVKIRNFLVEKYTGNSGKQIALHQNADRLRCFFGLRGKTKKSVFFLPGFVRRLKDERFLLEIAETMRHIMLALISFAQFAGHTKIEQELRALTDQTYFVFEDRDTIELSGLSIQLCQKGLNFHFSPEISPTFQKFLEIQ